MERMISIPVKRFEELIRSEMALDQVMHARWIRGGRIEGVLDAILSASVAPHHSEEDANNA